MTTLLPSMPVVFQGTQAVLTAEPPVCRVKSLDLHPTKPWSLAALYDGTVTITNTTTARLLRTIVVAPGVPVRSARFVAQKHWILTASDDQKLRVFDIVTGEQLASVKAHDDYIRGIAVHPTLPLVLTCSDDRTIKLWDWSLPTWTPIATFSGHEHYVMAVQWRPSATPELLEFASASLDRSARHWRITLDGHVTRVDVLQGHDKGLNALAFDASGQSLVTAADDHVLKVWDMATTAVRATLVGHTGNITCVATHPTQPLVISGAEDGTVRLWNTSTCRCEAVTTPREEDGRVWAVRFVEGASLLTIVGYDRGERVINMATENAATVARL